MNHSQPLQDIHFTQLLALNAAFESARAAQPIASTPLETALRLDSGEPFEVNMLTLLQHMLDQRS
ncbi:MAG: hypothetical protein QM803_19450 [Rhodocyclaceae bacterium]